MLCTKCKKEMPTGALFCPYCGHKIKAANMSSKSRTRPNGSGTAFKRGHTWTAQVTVAWTSDETMKPHRVLRTKGGFATKRAALEYCALLKNEKPKRTAPTLAEYWNIYHLGEFTQLSKSKQQAYSGAWKKLSSLHYCHVDHLTVSDLRSAVSAAASTYYTVRDCKQVLTHLFNLAAADGFASKDLPSFIVLPKLEEKERQSFSEEEQRSLWKLYESGDIRAAVPLLMIYTGMMPGEMQNLRVEHFDLEAAEIKGVGMKTQVRRASPVVIPRDALPLAQDLIANAQPSGYVFVRNEDKWYDTYYSVLKAAGCRRLEPYCCRHTTATRLAITENVAPQTIQRMMRWSTSRMLDRYAHPDVSDVHSAADRLTDV